MGKFREKMASGRFFSTVMVMSTYCFVIVGCTILALCNKMQIETFLALLTGFTGMAILIIESYFKIDRKNGT